MKTDCIVNTNNIKTELPCDICNCTESDINTCLNIVWKECIYRDKIIIKRP